MKRKHYKFLKDWLISSNRKPLVIRGARQVGKTWLVRQLAKDEDFYLLELNLEKNPQLAVYFTSNEPETILVKLSDHFNITIDKNKTILFIDEIQAAPELLAKLRWFAEDMPELAVIAAGSLLEFVLRKHSFSMPVGRIGYMHLEPLSFEEFLVALDKTRLFDYVNSYDFNKDIPDPIHDQFLSLVREYLIIGGMPEAIQKWSTSKSLIEVGKIQQNLISTYRNDFTKYSSKILPERLDEVMTSIPTYLGKKFVYSKINPLIPIAPIKQSLDLLSMAKVCSKVLATAANGIPLGAELQHKYLKVILLDVGLCSTILGLSLNEINSFDEINLVNSGGIAEQLAGQILRSVFEPYIEPRLYYWRRDEVGSTAEIDYVMQHGSKVIPIEVKAGSTGSLKSLHLFMGLKNYKVAVRVNSDKPSITNVSVKDQLGKNIEYKLISIPFYLLGQIHRFLD